MPGYDAPAFNEPQCAHHSDGGGGVCVCVFGGGGGWPGGAPYPKQLYWYPAVSIQSMKNNLKVKFSSWFHELEWNVEWQWLEKVAMMPVCELSCPRFYQMISLIHGLRMNGLEDRPPFMQFCQYSYKILWHAGGLVPPVCHKILQL